MLSFLKPLFAGSARIDAREALRMVEARQALLIDVRESDELRAGGRARGALHLPLSRIAEQGNPRSGHYERKLGPALQQGLPLLLYCASGARSGRAAGVLRNLGFQDVRNLGSLRDWLAAGGALQR